MNGFFGKVQKFFGGGSKPFAGSVKVRNHGAKSPTKSTPTARGRSATVGAFGGTGTGRNKRGKPGVKLLKKIIKAGFRAQKRTVFGQTVPHKIGTLGGKRQRKRLERVGLSAEWKAKNRARKQSCVMLFGTKHAPAGGFEKNFRAKKDGAK